MTSIFLVGMAVADFVFDVEEMPRTAEKHRATGARIVGGGGAANAAVAISRLGGTAHLAGRLGTDPVGDVIASGLEAEGVDLSQTSRTAGAVSSYSSVFIGRDGERQIVNFRGAGLPDRPAWSTPPVDAVLVDTRWEAGALEAMNLANTRGVPGVVDAEAPVPLPVIAAASHVAFSMQGLVDLTGLTDPEAALRAARVHTPAWLAVTDGANGVWTLDGDRLDHHPAERVAVVDTLGAGDIWHGAFALALAEGRDEPSAVRFASAAAALKCTRPGGRDGAPTRQDLDRYLKETAP
ncbi:MAG: PfkB family carbohydrate kinase [Pseudomonadota bacterium]